MKTHDSKDNVNSLDSSRNFRYSNMLFLMKEPKLYRYSGGIEVFRFTWLRTFHHPLAFRLQRENKKITLIVKETNGRGGYSPGELFLDTVLNITNDNWNDFVSKLNKIKFWNLSPHFDSFGFDGSEWILEGVSNQKYHFVTRWSPHLSDYSDCCEYLISLSKLKISPEDIY